MLPSFVTNLLGVAQIPLFNQQKQPGDGDSTTRGRHDWLQVRLQANDGRSTYAIAPELYTQAIIFCGFLPAGCDAIL